MPRRLPLVFASMFAACVTTYSGFAPNLSLSAVQRPQDVAERWGEYTLTPADSAGFLYEDGLVRLAVVPLSGSFSAVVENKTEHSMRLVWADASYVGPTGLSSGVVPGETRWMDFGNTPGPQTIPSRARASIVAIPRETADVSAMTIGGFYQGAGSCSELENTELRLILPLEIEGVVNEYTLLFESGSVEIVVYENDTLAGTTTMSSRTPC